MMKKKALSFIMIIVIIAILALILRVVFKQLMKIYSAQNESIAQATLKLVSTALENYARDNAGKFPENFSILTQIHPAYLDKDYITRSPIRGYNYICSKLDVSGYICSASPSACKITGRMVYTVTTGGLFISEGCEKKE